jgi:hypothetical protein
MAVDDLSGRYAGRLIFFCFVEKMKTEPHVKRH